MINPDPSLRPTASQLLEREELQWVEKRRRSPATIFEGLWGPSDAFLELQEGELGLCSQLSPHEPVIDEDCDMEL
jgi:mitosis inhibitor protein kinase SWE1